MCSRKCANYCFCCSCCCETHHQHTIRQINARKEEIREEDAGLRAEVARLQRESNLREVEEIKAKLEHMAAEAAKVKGGTDEGPEKTALKERLQYIEKELAKSH